MSSSRAVRSADAESRSHLEQSPAEPTIVELACSCGAVLRTRQPVAGMTCPVCGLTLPLPRAASLAHPPMQGAPITSHHGEAAPPKSVRQTQVQERTSRRLPPPRLGWAPSWRRTIFLLTIACAAVIGLTLRFEWRRQAAVQLGDNLAVGREALNAGRFDEAATTLARAARAARSLGENSPQTALALSLDREAQVWNRLSPRTIDEFFAEHGPKGGSDARRTFDREFAGRALVFDGFIEPVVSRANYGGAEPFGPRRPNADDGVDGAELQPAPPEQPGNDEARNESDAKVNAASADNTKGAVVASPWQLDWQLAGPGYVVELASDELTIFAGLPRTGATRVIFGGVIDRLEPLPGDTQRWRLHLVPESCVLLTAAGPLEQQQWPDAESWRPVLAVQARLLTESPRTGDAGGAKP